MVSEFSLIPSLSLSLTYICANCAAILCMFIIKHHANGFSICTLYFAKFLPSIDVHIQCKPLSEPVNKLLTAQCHTTHCYNSISYDVINDENHYYFKFFLINIIFIPQQYLTNFKLCSFLSGPRNYNGLLLRAEVLNRLGHFRSSLADADNAIKCRPTTYNVSVIV